MIKNIIFDIGGVLIDFSPARVMREMGLPEDEVQTIVKYTSGDLIWQELDRGVMPKEEVFEKMISNIPQQYKADAHEFLYNNILKTVEPFDYSKDWIKGLKEKGYKVYLLTNYPGWMFENHFKNVFTFSDFVDGKVVSAVVKLIKPDHRIYETILEKYNLVPEECVFIDDRLDNVEAARELGINAIQFTKFEEVQTKLNELLKK